MHQTLAARGCDTARLVLRPLRHSDLADLQRLQSDPEAWGGMLGGLRDADGTADDIAHDALSWAHLGVGLRSVRLRDGWAFAGVCGLHRRDDGRGIALRYAIRPEFRGRGLAVEAAAETLRDGHARGHDRIVGIAGAENVASIYVLRRIGMRLHDTFKRGNRAMAVFASGMGAA